MKKMLLLALVLGAPACKKKDAEPAADAAKKEMSDGKLEVALKDITWERVGEDGAARTDELIANLTFKNAGEKDLVVKKIDYTVVTGGDKRSDPKLWDKDPVTVAGTKSTDFDLHARLTWDGGGEMAYEGVQFDGTVYYTTNGTEKSEPFQLQGSATKKSP
jgi:hypothetical protein